MSNEHNDLLGDLLDDEKAIEEGTKEDPAVSSEELNALKSQVEELSSANAGLLKAKQAQTMKRQGAEERLAQLEGAVGTILSQRQRQGTESVSENQADAARAQGIPVTYDDDGNGWIDPSYVQNMLSPYQQKINDLEAKLQHTEAGSSAAMQAQKLMDSIIGENEQYGPASGRYRAARKWVEDQVLEFSQNNGVNRVMTSGEALDHVFSDPYIKKQFTSAFGEEMDLVDVVTAEDSQAHFRRTLDHIASAMTPKDDLTASPKEKMDSRFQQVLKKPSALGTQANAKAGQLSVLERISNLSTDDIMDLGDDQVETLLKLAGKD